jgi:predicted DNA-binding transcriptional regulator YafY
MAGRITDMANTSSRMLRLLSLLQTHRYWPGSELAERLEVSPRTLRRDVDRLRELGYPVQAQRGVEGGYQLAAGAVLPPLLLDDEEAVAIAVGLRTAANGMIEGISESSVRALAKVTQVMPSRLRRRVEALTAMTVTSTWTRPAMTGAASETLTGLALACRDTERVRFSYTAASGEESRRHVEPHRLVSLGRRWYLVGYDIDRGDWRSFRVDRIADVPRGTGARFRARELPGGQDAAAFVQAGIRERPKVYEAEVIFEAPAETVRQRIGQWGTIEDLGHHRCLARMTADSLDLAVMALITADAEFRVVGPPELAERVRDWGRRFTDAMMSG